MVSHFHFIFQFSIDFSSSNDAHSAFPPSLSLSFPFLISFEKCYFYLYRWGNLPKQILEHMRDCWHIYLWYMYKYIEHGSVYSQYTKHNIDGYRENWRDTAANRIELNHMLGVCVCSLKIFVSTIHTRGITGEKWLDLASMNVKPNNRF